VFALQKEDFVRNCVRQTREDPGMTGALFRALSNFGLNPERKLMSGPARSSAIGAVGSGILSALWGKTAIICSRAAATVVAARGIRRTAGGPSAAFEFPTHDPGDRQGAAGPPALDRKFYLL